jgi:serine/threonine-protein kinase HipA
MNNKDKLNIFYEDLKVGELYRDGELLYSFQYQDDWVKNPQAFALSLAMPLQQEVYGNKTTLSFFENLLPEGELRETIGRKNQIESSYEFLQLFGQDCAGAIIISESKKSPFKRENQSKVKLKIEDLYPAIEKHQSVAGVIADKNPGYLSLAGAQDKFPTIYENGDFYLPSQGVPTTHIVKVPIHREGIKESIYNEYFCMQLAKAIGFNIPNCFIRGDGAHPLFVIERYDRLKTHEGKIRRIHQQDFCQAQGIVSENKYEITGGPSIKDNYQVILNHVGFKKRIKSTYEYLDWICFNLLIGNNDSHSKNISLLLKEGNIEFAPLYDLLCTALYTQLVKHFSFKIGGRNKVEEIGKKQFEELDHELELKTGTMSEHMSMVCTKVMEQKEGLVKSMKDEYKNVKIMSRISKMIEERYAGFKNQGLKL